MGFIAPNLPATKVDEKDRKNILDKCLVDFAFHSSEDNEGVIRTNAERAARSLWDIALYAEAPRDRINALNTIYNRIGGKPNVKVEEDKQEMPEIVFKVSSKDSQRIKELCEREPVRTDEDSEGKVIVEIEGEPRMEF